jgi:hypothetical protein
MTSSSPATAGSDLGLRGLDLGLVIFYFLEIDYVPQFPEKHKFGYVPRFTEKRKLLCFSVPHGRGTAPISMKTYVS